MSEDIILVGSSAYPDWVRDAKTALFRKLVQLDLRIPHTIVFKKDVFRSGHDHLRSSLVAILQALEMNAGVTFCRLPVADFVLRKPWGDGEIRSEQPESTALPPASIFKSVPFWKRPRTLVFDTYDEGCTPVSHSSRCLMRLADGLLGIVRDVSSNTPNELILQLMLSSEPILFASVLTRNPGFSHSRPVGYCWTSSAGGHPIKFGVGDAFESPLRTVCAALERHFGCLCRVEITWDGNQITVLALHRVRADESAAFELIELADSFAYSDLRATATSSLSHIINREHLVVFARGKSFGRKQITGRAIFDVGRAREFEGDAILVQEEGTLDHVQYFPLLRGFVNRTGAVTSHLSVLARSMGLCCLVDTHELNLDISASRAIVGSATVSEGDWLTIDEVKGELYLGHGEIGETEISPERGRTMSKAAARRRHGVLVNADTCAGVEEGLKRGADGVGLCRSEHHLVDGQGLTEFRALFIGDPESAPIYRAHVIKSLKRELLDLLAVVNGRPFHYRLIDARLKELFALNEEGLQMLSETVGQSEEVLSERIVSLLSGRRIARFRGCRWALTDPMFYQDHLEAIIEAVIETRRKGISVNLKIIVPLVTTVGEMNYFRSLVDGLIAERLRLDDDCIIELGAMIETARAALCTAEIASVCSALCFGTNDLTESVWNISRDADSALVEDFLSSGHIRHSPFSTLDWKGVGRLLQLAIDAAHRSNPEVHCYLCGEQANDPDSLGPALEAGFDGVSCNSDMIQTAILAAAQFADQHENGSGYIAIPYVARVRRDSADSEARITAHLIQGRTVAAQEIAFDWARKISHRLGLPAADIWKFFKRDLVNLFFGRKPGRRFSSGWKTDDVLSYALFLKKEGHCRVRYSMFPRMIAAQSRTRQLTPDATDDEWRSELDAEDHSVALEIFPQPEHVRLAFRAVYHPSALDFEAGWGEAAELFWKSPGAEPMVTGQYVGGGSPQLHFSQGRVNIANEDLLSKPVAEFFEIHGLQLLANCDVICDALGLDWVSVEGYYAPDDGRRITVVDIDFALDAAFY